MDEMKTKKDTSRMDVPAEWQNAGVLCRHQGAASVQWQDKANLEDFSSQMEPSAKRASD